MSYNADAPNARLAYVGQDLFGSGVAMGERIVELVGEGKVGLFIATPGQLNIQPRIDGAIEAINESGANIESEQIETGPPSRGAAQPHRGVVPRQHRRRRDVRRRRRQHAGRRPGRAEPERTRPGLIGAGGYDLLPITVELVADGVLDFTIDQQPYLQGFLPVLYLYLSKLSGGVVLPPETNTGLVFLDQAGGAAVPRHLEPVRGRLRRAEDRRAGRRPGGTGDHRRLTGDATLRHR